jgi:hypothetical protein
MTTGLAWGASLRFGRHPGWRGTAAAAETRVGSEPQRMCFSEDAFSGGVGRPLSLAIGVEVEV